MNKEKIQEIQKRHLDLGTSTLHVDGLSKIWINHYLNDVSFLLNEVTKENKNVKYR